MAKSFLTGSEGASDSMVAGELILHILSTSEWTLKQWEAFDQQLARMTPEQLRKWMIFKTQGRMRG